ncbi:hypothetical protein OQA88_12981 [Cercophora sp. LCS_1]
MAEADDTCADFVDGEMLTEAEFFASNPGLDDVCDGLWVNYDYCIVGPSGIQGYPTPTTTVAPTPTPSGQAATCVRWLKSGAGLDCASIARAFGSFSEEFVSWNPSVGPTCKSLRPASWYCIGVSATPTTRTTPLVPDIPTTVGASFPTQTDVADPCEKWWLVGKNDDCERIAYLHDIEVAEFLEMDPAVGMTSCESLARDVYVCVETPAPVASSSSVVSSVASSSVASSSVPPSSTSSAPISTPTPTQVGSMTAGCRRFYLAQSGDGCWGVADAAGITLSDFYLWNSGLNGDCSGLWLG